MVCGAWRSVCESFREALGSSAPPPSSNLIYEMLYLGPIRTLFIGRMHTCLSRQDVLFLNRSDKQFCRSNFQFLQVGGKFFVGRSDLWHICNKTISRTSIGAKKDSRAPSYNGAKTATRKHSYKSSARHKWTGKGKKEKGTCRHADGELRKKMNI